MEDYQVADADTPLPTLVGPGNFCVAIRNPAVAAAIADELNRLVAEVERLRAELREHCDLAKSSNAEHADVEAAWRAEVERLREERRWRSTKTEPPSDDQWQVLIYDGRNVDIGDKLDGIGWTHEFGTLEWGGVTHWQPLPAPPSTTQQTPPME